MFQYLKFYCVGITLLLSLISCQNIPDTTSKNSKVNTSLFNVSISGDKIEVRLSHQKEALITQVIKSDFRPYIHPILAPQSKSSLTQYSPDHHRHQTGLYWGFTRVNGQDMDPDSIAKWFYRKDKPLEVQNQVGRDYFHNPDKGFWKKVSTNLLIDEGAKVRWQTIYYQLDAQGNPVLEETQTWTFTERDHKYFLDLEWQGKAMQNVTINKFDYGGLFLRMPWKDGMEGEAVNNARQRNQRAEGQRAMWVDVGMEIQGLDEWGHIAIFDHPDNPGFPNYWRVDSQLGIGPVPARELDLTIDKGEVLSFRHQIVAYAGTFQDILLDSLWSEYVEDDGMYNKAALWGIAQEEGRDATLLSPEEAVDQMTIHEDFEVNAYASEPMITQPMAFCWDDRGRLWIAENRDYESRGSGFANSGDSRILILEDTNQDGVADKQTVFLEDIPFPSAIAVGFDGLYLGAPPNLLFVPDRNRDDQADIDDIEVRLTGWGIRDRHETINSFHWGPDGWLYGLEGFATPSKIRKPQGNGTIYRHRDKFPEDLLESDGVDINGGVWRYHPIKDRFEVVAHGFSNPWGIDYDAKGQLFITACVIPHMFHVIPGGIYHRQGGRHFNPYVFQDIRTIVDHRHRSAHGGARIYLSDAFPEDQLGRLFMANIHEHAVLSDILVPNGSGFIATHGDDFMHANNAQWIGFSMELGPEGALYVLDWHDADICGKEVLNKETGRVFRITPKESSAENWPGRYADLSQLSDLVLVKLQSSKSSWHARRARVILQHRASFKSIDSDAITNLKNLFRSKNEDHRLRALWSLYITQNLSDSELVDFLEDEDPYVRGWAIQFLGEDKMMSNQTINELVNLAKKESSPITRLYLAASLQRMDHQNRWDLANQLTIYAEDITDPNIPFLLWFGIEPLVAENPQRALELLFKCKIPSISQNIARRLVHANELSTLIDALSKNFNTLDICKGMLAGLEGQGAISAPPNWDNQYEKLKNDAGLSEVVTQIAQFFGNAEATQSLLATIKNNQEEPRKKIQAIVRLAAQSNDDLVKEIPNLLLNPDLRITTIRAIAAYEVESLGEIVLQNFQAYTVPEKQEVLQTLSSRPIYASLLAEALKKNTITKKEVPPYIAAQLKRVLGNGFVEIWGPIDEIGSNIGAEYAKYKRLLKSSAINSANPIKGKSIFQKVCWACHKMYDDGGTMGPDLTGSNRFNVDYLLSNILEPSGEIQNDYQMVVITTQDGRTYSGNITKESNDQLNISIVGQDNIVINKSNIRSRETVPQSMMPEGLLNTLTEEEILDLVAFLQTTEPINRI